MRWPPPGGRPTSRTGTLPVLSGLRLEVHGRRADGHRHRPRAVDPADVTVGGERDGAVVVPARLVADIVRSLPAGAVEVGARRRRGEHQRRPLAVLDPAARRSTTTRSRREPAAEAVTLSSAAVAEALRQVVRAASTDDARAVLTGVLIAAEDDGVRMVATDSYRLAVRDLPESEMLGQRPEGARAEPGAATSCSACSAAASELHGAPRRARRRVRGRRHAPHDAPDRGRVPELPQPAPVVVPERAHGRARGAARGAAPGEDPRPGRHAGAPAARRRHAAADGDHPGRRQRRRGDRRHATRAPR